MVLPLGDRAWHGRWAMCFRRWSRWASVTRSREAALEQPLVGRRWAWAGFWLILVGTVTAMVPVSLGLASVLYTFYPPLIGNPFYYIGVVLVVVGSWIWVALMSINLRGLEARQSGQAGAARDVRQCRRLLSLGLGPRSARRWSCLFQIIPVALGLQDHHRCRTGARVLLLDAACHRLFLADADLHRLLHHRAAGDRRPALQRRDGRASPSSCSWSWRCRSACTISSPIRRSAPASSSSIRCSPPLSRCRRC